MATRTPADDKTKSPRAPPRRAPAPPKAPGTPRRSPFPATSPRAPPRETWPGEPAARSGIEWAPHPEPVPPRGRAYGAKAPLAPPAFEAWPPPSGPYPGAPSPTPTWVLPLGLGILAAILLPFVVFGILGQGGPGFAFPALLVAALIVGMTVGLGRNYRKGAAPSRPGLPAPFGAPLYGIPTQGNVFSLRDRLRSVDQPLRALHHRFLWALVALVAAAGLMVLGAILFGNEGQRAGLAGLVLLFGWVVTLAAYFTAGYRSMLPAAVALLLYGLLLHVEAVAQAWGWHHDWDSSALLLLVVLTPLQAIGAEAAFRVHPRGFWAAWAAIGTLAATALPLWLFFGAGLESHDHAARIFTGLSVASLAWGVGAVFAFTRIPDPVRWAGLAVFAAWCTSIVVAFVREDDVAYRLQAAGLVAAAIVAAVAVTSYFVTRPSTEPEAA